MYVAKCKKKRGLVVVVVVDYYNILLPYFGPIFTLVFLYLIRNIEKTMENLFFHPSCLLKKKEKILSTKDCVAYTENNPRGIRVID